MFGTSFSIVPQRRLTLLFLLSIWNCMSPTDALPAQNFGNGENAHFTNSIGSPFSAAFLPVIPAQGDANSTSLARRQGCPDLTLLCPSGVCCSYDSSCCGNTCCPSGYLCTGGTPDAPCCVSITSSDNICVNPCERPGDLPCTGVNICCPPDNFCYYDSFGTARCSPLGGSGGTPTPGPIPSPTPSKSFSSSSLTTPVFSSDSSSFIMTTLSPYSYTTTTTSYSPTPTTTSSFVPPDRGDDTSFSANTLSPGTIGGIAGGAAGGTIAIVAGIWVIWHYCYVKRKRYVHIEDSGIYKSLPLGKDHRIEKLIRILEILPGSLSDNEPLECNLFVVSLDSAAVSYEALSYRWKGAQDCKIHVNGAKCIIRENLGSALRHLRHPNASRFVWCDAICINQSKKKSNREKDKQILLMGQIYSRAQQVLVWLDKPTPESDSAMEYFAKFPGPEWCGGLPLQVQMDLSYHEHHKWWLDFGKGLLSTDWWGRAWMVQELVLARRLTFVCGRYSMDEASFYLIASWGTAQNRTVFDGPVTDNEMALRRSAWFRMMYQRVVKQGGYGGDDEALKVDLGEIGFGRDGISQPRNDIGFWIGQFHEWGASDPKDRVYAYLPFDDQCPIQPSILPKDLPFTEVYRLVTEHIIKSSGSLDFICLGRALPRSKLDDETRKSSDGDSRGKSMLLRLLCFRFRFRRPSTNRLEYLTELPSWTPDLSQPFGANPPLPPVNFGLRTAFRASNGRAFDGAFEDFYPNASLDLRTSIRTRQRAMRVTARRVGAIVAVGVEHRADNEVEAVEESKLLAGLGPAPNHPFQNHPYPGDATQTRLLALSRTLVWGLNHDRRPCVDDEGFFADIREAAVPDSYNRHLRTAEFADERERERSFGIDSAVSKYNFRLGRRTALLDNGFIGMVPKACCNQVVSNNNTTTYDNHQQQQQQQQSEYEVYILAGASLPMVLRRLPSSKQGLFGSGDENDGATACFELVGECYVHGVMDGEVYRNTFVHDVVITLV